MNPLVSVIMPTYNRAAYLPEAINSVLNQSFKDLELVVVDDGSTDGTRNLIKTNWSDPRLVFHSQTNQGFSTARNCALALARGKYLGFLDSDDIYFKDTLAVHLQAFSDQPSLGMTVGGYNYIDARGLELDQRRPWTEGGALDLPGWLFNCYTVPSAILLRRSWFERVGNFDPAATAASDWDLFLRLVLAGCPMDWVKRPVCQYRIHTGNMSRQILNHQEGALEVIDKVFKSPQFPSTLAVSKSQAQAWVYVVYSKKAIASGEVAFASKNLREALRLDLELKEKRKVDLLEMLLSDEPCNLQRPPLTYSNFLGFLPGDLRVGYWDWQSALARLAMSKFFRTMKLGTQDEALTYLIDGLKHNPFWLSNKGVLAFIVHYTLDRIHKRIRPDASAV